MVRYSGRWYVVGLDTDRGEERVFRLSRVQGEARKVGAPGSYDVPPGTDVRATTLRLAPEPPTGRAVVLVRAGSGLALRRDAESVEPGVAGPDDRTGWDRVVINRGGPGAADELLGYGADVYVEEPDDPASAGRRRGSRRSWRRPDEHRSAERRQGPGRPAAHPRPVPARPRPGPRRRRRRGARRPPGAAAQRPQGAADVRPAGRLPRRPDRRRPGRAGGPRGRRRDPGVERRLPGPPAAADARPRRPRSSSPCARCAAAPRTRPARSSTGRCPSSRRRRPRRLGRTPDRPGRRRHRHRPGPARGAAPGRRRPRRAGRDHLLRARPATRSPSGSSTPAGWSPRTASPTSTPGATAPRRPDCSASTASAGPRSPNNLL